MREFKNARISLILLREFNMRGIKDARKFVLREFKDT